MRKFFDRLRFERDHRWAPGRMSAYLDDELGPRARRRLEQHAGECVQCRRMLAGLRRTLGALQRLPAPAGGDAEQIAASVRLRLREPPGS
jgi:anti-sigma factor RsiW